MGMLMSALRVARSFLGSGSLRILFYHQVLASPDPLQPPVTHAALFDAQMAMLARLFRVLPLPEAAERLAAGTLPPRAVCITFDDGYRNNIEIAYPILRRHALTAAYFVASGLLDGGLMYNDVVLESVRRLPPGPLDLSWAGLGVCLVDGPASRLDLISRLTRIVKYMTSAEREVACERLRSLAGAPLPADVMLSSEQVRELARNGMTVGGHTLTHPILTRTTPEQARAEIEGDRARLGAILGAAPDAFAYPNGKPGVDFDEAHVELVRAAGYRTALTTAWGVAHHGDAALRLPRICLESCRPASFAARLLHAERAAAPSGAVVERGPSSVVTGQGIGPG